MMMFREAIFGIQRNLGAFALYAAVSVGLLSARLGVEHFVIYPGVAPQNREPIPLYEFLTLLVSVLVFAPVQCVAFGRIGREMDRPYWKIRSDWESIKRFFQLWLIIDLAIVCIAQLLYTHLERVGEEGFWLFFLWLFSAGLFIAFGAGVMFAGKLGREELGWAVQVLMTNPAHTFLIMVGGFAFYSAVLTMDSLVPFWARPLTGVLDAFTDCLLFASGWYLCMLHREREEGVDYNDFDM